MADKNEQLGRLAHRLIGDVHEHDDRKQHRRAARDPNHSRRARERLSHPTRAAQEAAKAREGALALSWHRSLGSALRRLCTWLTRSPGLEIRLLFPLVASFQIAAPYSHGSSHP
jgi:hypothetical protein